MARTYQSVDNKRGYAFVVFAREYEKHMGYGWFVALRNVGGAPSKWEWMDEALFLYDSHLEPDDPHDLANAIVRGMSQELYRENRHRLRAKGPRGSQVVEVVDVPTEPPLVYGAAVEPELNPAAAVLVRRMSELPMTPTQRRVFDFLWDGGSSLSKAEMARELGMPVSTVWTVLRDIRRKCEKSGIRAASRSVDICMRSGGGSGAVPNG